MLNLTNALCWNVEGCVYMMYILLLKTVCIIIVIYLCLLGSTFLIILENSS